MKKILSVLCVMLTLILCLSCGKKEAQTAEEPTVSQNYKSAVECINKYENDIKAAKSCQDLETATSNFYNAQAQIEVPDKAEREQLKPMVDRVQKTFLQKYEELGCAAVSEDEPVEEK